MHKSQINFYAFTFIALHTYLFTCTYYVHVHTYFVHNVIAIWKEYDADKVRENEDV